MKKGWEVKKLGDVCEIKPPKKLAKDKLTDEDLVTFFPMTDLKAFNRNIKPIQSKRLKDVYKGYVYFQDNDVLLAKITPCFENGKLGIAKGLKNGVGFGSSEYMVFRPHEGISSEYIYYFLSLDYIRREGKKRMTGAVGHKRIPVDYVSNQKLILPPLPDQKRIVKILDKAFAAIDKAKANAEKNLANSRELFNSLLAKTVIGAIEPHSRYNSDNVTGVADLECIKKKINGGGKRKLRAEPTVGKEIIKKLLPKGWALTDIESLFNLIDYRGKNPKRAEKGIRLITAKNIRMGFLAEEPITFVTEQTYKDWMTRGFPELGDIFFVTEGHTMGFVALNIRKDKFALAQRTITLQPATPLDTRYFFYYMMSFHFQNVVKLNATGAAAVGMKGAKLRSLPMPFPSIAEQKDIANRLDALSNDTKALESNYVRRIEALNNMKQSILKNAFEGEL